MTAETRPSLDELGQALVAGGVLSSDWVSAFVAVPRSAFLPDLMWPFDMETGESVPVSMSEDPDAWVRYADSDAPIVTQWDDGQHTGKEPGKVSTSSASMPSVVFRMLGDLAPEPGHRVLEVGTGSGWDAALLAYRVGAGNVVTLEVDETVAAQARAALSRAGFPVHVITGDGFEGCEEGAPYDRIIATCGLRSFPFAWVRQSRAGAVLVAPWGTHYGNGDAVARLVVAEDGESASGAFTGPVQFMKLRAQRATPVRHEDYVPDGVGKADRSSTSLQEADVVTDRFAPSRFALGLRVPACTQVDAAKVNGARPVWLYSRSDRSWACAMFQDGQDEAAVWQSGPRHLWDEVEAAYRWWEDRGKPGFERFGLTVTAEGQTAWLDDPSDSWMV